MFYFYIRLKHTIATSIIALDITVRGTSFIVYEHVCTARLSQLSVCRVLRRWLLVYEVPSGESLILDLWIRLTDQPRHASTRRELFDCENFVLFGILLASMSFSLFPLYYSGSWHHSEPSG